MHIKKILVDGFKSYAKETVITGFDSHFNAITGLNGSGKSNILDSICFVLGITNLSQVRAGNLTELVYKQGQAGVNKATVTITFDNEDESNSPAGYEAYKEIIVTRQVLLGGKSKYYINGRTAVAKKVQDLFHSVQLNVNNPHFLIMQGRITKVLNMKPNEILGMVEEAAGTRMYETKRVNALTTIDKKQLKLDQINSVLCEEITPTLEKLRGEKQSYLKWSKIHADIERLERLVVAGEYHKALLALDAEGYSELEEQLEIVQDRVKQSHDALHVKDHEIEERAANADVSAELKQIKKEEDTLSKDVVKELSAWESAQENVASAQIDVKAAQFSLDECLTAVASKEHDIANDTTNTEQMLIDAQQAEDRCAQLTNDYQNMCAGISSSQGDDGRTLPEQISQAHADSMGAAAKIDQTEMKIKHLSKEMKSVASDLDKQKKSSTDLTSKKEKAAAKVAQLQEETAGLNFSFDEYNALDKEKSDLEGAAVEMIERIETLQALLGARLSFQYTDPVRGFDRSKVKGVVAKLVKMKDTAHATALEVAAGGKLFQVVVDDHITSKALIERGQLRQRVTFIPLDKIQLSSVSHATLDRAIAIGKNYNAMVMPAIDLIEFDEEVRNAMEYAFGSTIIVDNSKAADEICTATKTRTVTLEGDVYEPGGIISGGSAGNMGHSLSNIAEVATKTKELSQIKTRLATVCARFSSMAASASTFDKISAKLNLALAELDSAQKHLSNTSYGMLTERLDAITAELQAAGIELDGMQKKRDEKWNLYEHLKAQESNLTQQREDRLRDLEIAVKAAKAEAADKSKRAREIGSQAETLKLELDELRLEVIVARECLEAANVALSSAVKKEETLQMKLGQVRADYDEVKAKLVCMEAKWADGQAELAGLKDERATMMKETENLKLEEKKLSIQLSRMQKDREEAEKKIIGLETKYSWVLNEKHAFGISGGDYDFAATNLEAVSKDLHSRKKEQETLSKKVNKKVMGMIEKAESEYTELLRKRKVVENDKKKIQAVIQELDVKKKAEVERTWVKVNRDFGSIFATLLPGTRAKLEPPDGMAAWEGLEVKVAFGDVWKETLSELSGGQRSLLALSLILSLLLFKPAPMYILDEVDSALDLSHTQNIGLMLKTHFSQSQFIVVSLKEGMFNNANVIFRTKFVDGISTVTRTLGTGYGRSPALTTFNSHPAESNEKAGRGKKNGKENTTRVG
ncbi:hypothetical protein MPSEU_000798500 [Mayamaea pseudoterrestris]|nr:hypothetical protein MPSEU_000798500 [Mayamaea pseudoterrestris]